MKKSASIIGICIVSLSMPLVGFGQVSIEPTQHLQVSTIQRPPFAMVGQNGLEGFSVDLWEEIAHDNNWSYDYLVHDSFVAMISSIKSPESSDLALADISISHDREAIMDFSSTIYQGGLQILLNTQPMHIIQRLFEDQRVQLLLGSLALSFFSIGWLIHRTSNTPVWQRSLWSTYMHLIVMGQLNRPLHRRDPARVPLRLWRLLVLVLVSLLLWEVITLSRLYYQAPHTIVPSDLERRLVGVTEGSRAENVLRKLHIPTISYRSSRVLLRDVHHGVIDAAVHDEAVLRHHLANHPQTKQGASIVGAVFSQEQYGIALPTQSTLRESLNTSLEVLKRDGRYDQIYQRWFGIQDK